MTRSSNGNPLDMLFWYNCSPKSQQLVESIPSNGIFKHSWRTPNCKTSTEVEVSDNDQFQIGQLVWVKPNNVKCTTKWDLGRITRKTSSSNYEVDGMSRHVGDLPVASVIEEGSSESDSEVESSNKNPPLPARIRRMPMRLDDYDVG